MKIHVWAKFVAFSLIVYFFNAVFFHSAASPNEGWFPDTSKRPEYKKKCEQGDIPSCLALAQIELGEDNVEEARKLYKLSCKKGNEEGCARLKLMEEDEMYADPEGRKKIEKGCEGGDLEMCRIKADKMRDNRDWEGARKLYEMIAQKRGLPSDFYRLAGVEKYLGNVFEARISLQEACDKQHENACISLAYTILHEDLNYPEAKRVLDDACRKGMEKACSESKMVDQYTEKGTFRKSKKALEEGCERGVMQSCERLLKLKKTLPKQK